MLVSESRKTCYIVIEKEKCKACLYCIAACPKQVIGLSREINKFGFNYAEPISSRMHECSGCNACAIMCPDVAISVYRSHVSEDDGIS